MGFISKVIGLLFTGAGMLVLFLGSNSDPMVFTISIFIGMIMMSIGFGLLNAGRQAKATKPPPPTVTEIRCDNPNCDFKEIRNFESGDYILKTLQVHCPKCESTMTIQGIYIVKEDDETEKLRI